MMSSLALGGDMATLGSNTRWRWGPLAPPSALWLVARLQKSHDYASEGKRRIVKRMGDQGSENS
jgi:hypothetical protein